MNCPMEARQGSELLLEYTAGRLEACEASALEAHLESCTRCREFARSQKMVWQALEAWEAEPVSMDFDRRLFARIERAPVSWWALRCCMDSRIASGLGRLRNFDSQS